jgi:hypothetical protein
MRTYLAKIRIPEEIKSYSTGAIGEEIFSLWFNINYQGEKLFKQSADREFDKIDFADEKGYTFQVKATTQKTYTFSCEIDDATDHLKAELYVFIQIKDKYAYIEPICKKQDILDRLKKSFRTSNTCFVYAMDLLQEKLFI